MIKRLNVCKFKDRYGTVDSELVMDESGTELFNVRNLCDCPEDATIGRALFDAHDWIRAVVYGMRLYKKGFTLVDVNTFECEEDD